MRCPNVRKGGKGFRLSFPSCFWLAQGSSRIDLLVGISQDTEAYGFSSVVLSVPSFSTRSLYSCSLSLVSVLFFCDYYHIF